MILSDGNSHTSSNKIIMYCIQASITMLNVKICDSAIRKLLNKYAGLDEFQTRYANLYDPGLWWSNVVQWRINQQQSHRQPKFTDAASELDHRATEKGGLVCCVVFSFTSHGCSGACAYLGNTWDQDTRYMYTYK